MLYGPLKLRATTFWNRPSARDIQIWLRLKSVQYRLSASQSTAIPDNTDIAAAWKADTRPKLKVKGPAQLLMEPHLTAARCHLPCGITQCYLPPDTSEHTPGWYSIYLPGGIEGWADLEHSHVSSSSNSINKLVLRHLMQNNHRHEYSCLWE